MKLVRDAWIAAFLVVIFAPIVIRLVSFERQGFWQELVTVTGLLATSMLVCAVVLTARIRSITRAFGIETVLVAHRALGVCAAALGLAHIAAVIAVDPRNVAFLAFLAPALTSTPVLNIHINPAPLRAIFGMIALLSLVAIVLLAAWRRGRYEIFRNWHVALWALLWVTTAAHVVLIGHLFPYKGMRFVLRGDPAALVVLLGDVASNPIGAVFLAALAAVVAAVTVRRWMLLPLRRRGRYRVSRVHAEAPTVSTLVLQPDGAGSALTFQPGQFAWLRLGRDPFAQEHPFTISSAARAGRDVEFTIRHAGDWTKEVLPRLRPGDRVWLDGPHGALTPSRTASGLVLIAGGVGIAPMMSILRTAAQDSDRRPIRLLLTDRPGDGLYRAELNRLATTLALQRHELGRTPLTAELFAAVLPPKFVRDRLEYLVCGPPALVDDATTALHALGVPDRQVRTERFDA